MMHRSFTLTRYAVLASSLGLGLGFCSALEAQTTSGTILGSVEDPAHTPVAGAEVTATNPGTRLGSRAFTNQEGSFVLSGLSPGRYEVQVRKVGFRMLSQA